MTYTIGISTYNCRGLRADKNRLKVYEWLRGKKSDLIFLQETHCIKQDENRWKKEWNGDIIFSNGTRDSRGVMILLKPNPNIEIVNVSTGEDSGRVLFVTLNMYGLETLVVNVYAPNEDNEEFYDRLFKKINEIDSQYIVIGGDFNLVLDVKNDKYGGIMRTNEKARACVLKYMDTLELYDVWRMLNEELREYTWRRRKPKIIQCRLDFFLLSQGICNKVQNCNIGGSYLSDHSIVNLGFKLDTLLRGPGFWKLNCAVLKEKEYINKIKQTINEVESQYENTNTDKLLFWEMYKMNIRSSTIQYSCMRKKESKLREADLENRIKVLEQSTYDKDREELEEKRAELCKIMEEKVRGNIVRSRAKIYEEDEKSSKYFLSLEKHSQAQKAITLMKDKEGNLLNKQEAIRDEIHKFYSELYEEDNLSDKKIEEEFFNSTTLCLDEQEADTCEGLITRKELLDALKQSSNNKAPGIDGIPTDFYKVFWNSISGHLLDALNYAFQKEMQSCNQRKGVISLIPKRNKDPLYVKNWRPITLLCADYKLASKVIANRIKLHLPKLINSDQTGFVKGRYIGQNIDILLQMIEFSDFYQKPGIVLGVDYAKAFDQLSWGFIERVLIKYNFGTMLIKWVKLFLNNSNAVVNVNGWFTSEIAIRKGVKQGDCISPYIFILCAEIFAEYIRKCKNIKGICIGDTECKISQLADDTNILLYIVTNP